MPGRFALIAGLALAAVAATVFGVVRWSSAADAGAPVPTATEACALPSDERPKPPIDAAQPSETETATFAMG